MTTGWLIVNIVLAVVVTAIVAVPAVLIPLLLDRDRRTVARIPRSGRQVAPTRSWAAHDQQRKAA